MRISALISLGSRYLVLGGILAAIVVVFILLIYHFAFKGKKKLKKTTLLWWTLFICYIVVVLGVTLMERGNFWQTSKIMPLFYSYKEAWVSGLAVDWRNIILNICMFIPLGFLLPLGFPIFESFWLTSFTGFLFTAIIEGVQLYFHLGMFELDDLMNNTVGTMIGYGFYVIYGVIILKQKFAIKKITLSQIPLCITFGVFMTLFTIYQVRELGNIPYQCMIPFEKEKLKVSSEITFSSDIKTMPVYKCKMLSKEDTIAFAKAFFENLGEELDESRNDFYDETAVFHSTDRFSLWINYQGGDYRLTDFETTFSEEVGVKTDATEEEIREALTRYGIYVPEELKMESISGTDTLAFEFDQYQLENLILDGHLNFVYSESGDFSNIDYSIITSEAYKEFEIISEEDAYEMICDGQFNYHGAEELNLIVTSCSLEYVIDTKGFYQPYYQFICTANGKDTTFGIPAIQK